MVAYFFIKGLDSGYSITSTIGSQEELVATGLILFMGFIDEILIEAFWKLLSYWKFYLLGGVIGLISAVFIVLFEKKTNKEVPLDKVSKLESYLQYLFVLLIIIYLFLSCPITALNKGKEHALNDIKQINKQGCKLESAIWGKCSKIRYDTLLKSVELEGYLLNKKDREITIYLPKEKVLRTLILQKDAIIERSYVGE